MTFQDEIFKYVLRAKCVASFRAEMLINQKNSGEDVECCELRLVLLAKWISLLESYYCENFGDGGNVTPAYACLTFDQAQSLLAKLKAFIK